MTSLRQVLTCSALAALTALLIAATAAVCVVAEVLTRIPAQVDAAIVETRSQVLGQFADAEHDILQHLTALEAKADGRLGQIEEDARAELAATRELVDSQLGATLTRADAALAEVHELHADVAPILAHAGSVAKQVDQAAPLFLDCDHNVDCAFNRFQGTAKAVERASQNVGAMTSEVRAALPPALATWQRIGGNVDQTSANVAKITKPHWYDNLIKGLAVGATVGGVLR